MNHRCLAVLWVALSGCAVDVRDRVSTEVLAATRAFEAAEKDRDVDALLAFLDESFYMYGDGKRADYATTVAQIRATMPTLRAFEPRFENIEVIVISEDAALVTMTFRDVITTADGTTTRKRGPTTMLWRRRGEDWRIVFVDADHYPDG